MLKKTLIALAMFSGCASAATGNDLYKWHNSNQSSEQGYYSGYISASVQWIDGICPAAGVTEQQVWDIVYNWLVKYPQSRHLDSKVIIEMAMREAFPCS